ncbi:unnamed protein product [Blepharisma stoltei]|uniref:Uncharacterized protein n=1 Tax=Blepharisma stoltei TaxID=1481888 RepID=A0AAU9J4L9_9CILI|nr:unnamed protein product [Blepharisma stoltei]
MTTNKYTFSGKADFERSLRIKSRGSGSREVRIYKKFKKSTAIASSPSMSTKESLICSFQNQSIESISGHVCQNKPPRVPPLLTKTILQHKNKEKSERGTFTQADDFFFLNQHRKIEIIKSRQFFSSKLPFWFQDAILFDISTKRSSNSNRCLHIEDLIPKDIKRSDFVKWVNCMTENRN